MAATLNRSVVAGAMLIGGLAIGWGAAQWRGTGVPASGPVASAASAAPAAPASAERKVLYWYDPMSPAQHFDRPGKSPFMDMALVPRYAEEASAPAASAAPSLALSGEARQSLGVRLARVAKRSVGATIDATGTLQLDDRNVSIVQARAAGFVERAYGRAAGDVVAAGAPFADVMNPGRLTADALFLAVNATRATGLMNAAP